VEDVVYAIVAAAGTPASEPIPFTAAKLAG
jgi:hypothetical protein